MFDPARGFEISLLSLVIDDYAKRHDLTPDQARDKLTVVELEKLVSDYFAYRSIVDVQSNIDYVTIVLSDYSRFSVGRQATQEQGSLDNSSAVGIINERSKSL